MEPSPSPKRSGPISARTKSVKRGGPELPLDDRGLLPVGSRALIGVSGGRDSVALLDALIRRGDRQLIVCHFNHALRSESAAEADFVAKLAAQHGLEVELGQWSTAAGPGRKWSEAAAREHRYQFFARAASQHACSELYLAHHADDQVETLLFNLLRGSGMTGLSGMRPLAERNLGGTTLRLLRPLLGVWRGEIDTYLAANALTYCEDASNADVRHTRNRLRHEILPALEAALQRKIGPALWRAAEILTSEDELLASLTPNIGNTGEAAVETLRDLPTALQRRALHAWLRESGVPNVNFEDVENVRLLLTRIAPAKVNLSGGWYARRQAKRLFLERKS